MTGRFTSDYVSDSEWTHDSLINAESSLIITHSNWVELTSTQPEHYVRVLQTQSPTICNVLCTFWLSRFLIRRSLRSVCTSGFFLFVIECWASGLRRAWAPVYWRKEMKDGDSAINTSILHTKIHSDWWRTSFGVKYGRVSYRRKWKKKWTGESKIKAKR